MPICNTVAMLDRRPMAARAPGSFERSKNSGFSIKLPEDAVLATHLEPPVSTGLNTVWWLWPVDC